MFRNEMSSQARPSLDGMPEKVLAKGRRARRARTAKIAFAAVAVGIVAVAGADDAAGSHGRFRAPAGSGSGARGGSGAEKRIFPGA
jgi:hypothetical protein